MNGIVVNIKDTLVRAAKTAVQVFIAGVGADLLGADIATIETAAWAAAAAGVSIIMNAILTWSQSDD